MSKTSDTATKSGEEACLSHIIGHKFKVQREKIGLSRSKLAMMTGVSVSKISRLENGNAEISIFLEIAKALGISLVEIINEAERETMR